MQKKLKFIKANPVLRSRGSSIALLRKKASRDSGRGRGKRRNMSSGKIRRLALTLSVAFATFALPVSVAGASQTTVGPIPNVIACPSSGQVYEIASSSTFLAGVGTIYTDHNPGTNSTTFVVNKTLSDTYTGSLTGTVSTNADFIIASIDASLSITLEKSYSSSTSVSESLTIPPGDYGIVQQADLINVTNGTLGNYEGGSIGAPGELCPLANAVPVTTRYAENNYVNYEATGTATSLTPPWPQG